MKETHILLGWMNVISHKPAHTVAEFESARQHQNPGRPPWSARWRPPNRHLSWPGDDLAGNNRLLGL